MHTLNLMEQHINNQHETIKQLKIQNNLKLYELELINEEELSKRLTQNK